MTTAGVVLAAGASSRMGTPKQLLLVEGRPLLGRVVAAACASSLDEVFVVLGANAKMVRAGIPWGRARTVVNEAHAQGMSTSVRAGLSVLGPHVDVAVIILGDQPDIRAALIDSLLAARVAARLPAAALSFDGLLHPPVAMAREMWAELMSLEGDVGCRRLIRARPELVAAVPAQVPGHHPVDIDTPEDFAQLTSTTATPRTQVDVRDMFA